jgi:hypothetical protein
MLQPKYFKYTTSNPWFRPKFVLTDDGVARSRLLTPVKSATGSIVGKLIHCVAMPLT